MCKWQAARQTRHCGSNRRQGETGSTCKASIEKHYHSYNVCVCVYVLMGASEVATAAAFEAADDAHPGDAHAKQETGSGRGRQAGADRAAGQVREGEEEERQQYKERASVGCLVQTAARSCGENAVHPTQLCQAASDALWTHTVQGCSAEAIASMMHQ